MSAVDILGAVASLRGENARPIDSGTFSGVVWVPVRFFREWDADEFVALERYLDSFDEESGDEPK